MSTSLITLVTVYLAQIGGWLDLHAALRGPALVLLVAACLLAIADPRSAWRWALMLGLALPIAHVVSRVTGTPLRWDVSSFRLTFLALVPALLGAAIGLRVRRGAHPGEAEPHRHS